MYKYVPPKQKIPFSVKIYFKWLRFRYYMSWKQKVYYIAIFALWTIILTQVIHGFIRTF